MFSDSRRTRRVLLIAAIFVLLQVIGIFVFLWLREKPAIIVADYGADFQSETPKAGWRYLLERHGTDWSRQQLRSARVEWIGLQF